MSERRPIPRLVLVIDSKQTRWPAQDLATAAAAGGVGAIYLRDAKRAGSQEIGIPLPAAGGAPTLWNAVGEEVLFAAVRERIDPAVTILVNRPWDGDWPASVGLHLRERDPIPDWTSDTRARPSLVGRSVHTAESAAASTGVDYLLAGHVYASASKPGKPPLGREGLARIVAAAPCPVIAIGGITAERVAEVGRAGAHGVAVIGAIAEAADPYLATMELRTAIDVTWPIESETRAVTQTDITTKNGTTFEIIVNGKSVAVPERSTIHDFLASKGMTGAMAIVERNGEIVPRGAYARTAFIPGDIIEVVHAVGGG